MTPPARTALFHIVDRATWARAVQVGEYRPDSLVDEGFVHFSFADQVEATANRRFAEVDGLCVIEFDPARLGAEVVVEDSYGSGTEFPHVYAAVPTSAAVNIHELPCDVTGRLRFSPGAEADPA